MVGRAVALFGATDALQRATSKPSPRQSRQNPIRKRGIGDEIANQEYYSLPWHCKPNKNVRPNDSVADEEFNMQFASLGYDVVPGGSAEAVLNPVVGGIIILVIGSLLLSGDTPKREAPPPKPAPTVQPS